MEIFYDSFDGYDLEEEIKKIKVCDVVNIRVNTKDKGMLFLMGMLFALNKNIRIMNRDEVIDEVQRYKIDLEQPTKSFNLMAYVWEKLCDNKFNHSSVNNNFDSIIENIKRAGVSFGIKSSEAVPNKIFMICPVRGASEEELNKMKKYVSDSKKCGYSVYNPNTDTVQADILGGYSICRQNDSELGSSESVHIFYNRNSMGSLFDLGCAYVYGKPLEVINDNELVYDENDFGDRIVKNWKKREPLLCFN